MITDRTQADVDSIDKSSSSINKGAYNYTDLNRVEAKVKELGDLLAGYNYLNSTPATKLDWTLSDKFTPNDATRYLNNLKIIKNALASLTTTPSVPTTMQYMSFETANNIEKILVDIEMLITAMKHYFVYSNVANSGQRRLWQNRFRHRLASIWSDLTETTWSDFGTERWEDIMYEDNY